MAELGRRLWRDEGGQDLVEYTLLLVLIALTVVAALRLLGIEIGGALNNAASQAQGDLNGS